MIKKLTTIFCLLVVPLFFIKTPTSVLSEEIRYPIACYEGKELEKVRQWEKTWAGKKIDSTNVDEVKELLPEGFYDLTKNAERWGRSWFEIVPYRPYQLPTGRIAATKKYSPASKLSPEGELLNWVAGVPFPEPKSGIEVAWNFWCWNRNDGQFKIVEGYVVDGRRKYDRIVGNDLEILQFSGRSDVSPIPEIVPNPKGIFRANLAEFFRPSEIKGQIYLGVNYKDFSKEYDAWIWITAIRRIRRLSTIQRTDTTGGQDNCYDDNYNWDGDIMRNTYELMGRKEILLARHQDMKQFKHTEGECFFTGGQKERINTYALKVVNKDPGYIYSKSIWYVDPELWHITYADKYDRHGKLWKSMDHFQKVYKDSKGEDAQEFCGATTIDHQRTHATVASVPEMKIGVEIPTRDFTIINLQKRGR